MKTVAKFFVLLSLLFVGPILAQHQTTIGKWTWPKPIDANSVENRAKLDDVTAWLTRHGTPGSYALTFYQIAKVPVQDGDNPPNWPYLIFCKDWLGRQPAIQFDDASFALFSGYEDNPRCAVHDFALVIQSPSTTLAELKNRFQFGNPLILEPYPDPPDPTKPAPLPAPAPKPTVPVGGEILGASGRYYALDSSFADWLDARGRFKRECRESPFGRSCWFAIQ